MPMRAPQVQQIKWPWVYARSMEPGHGDWPPKGQILWDTTKIPRDYDGPLYVSPDNGAVASCRDPFRVHVRRGRVRWERLAYHNGGGPSSSSASLLIEDPLHVRPDFACDPQASGGIAAAEQSADLSGLTQDVEGTWFDPRWAGNPCPRFRDEPERRARAADKARRCKIQNKGLH